MDLLKNRNTHIDYNGKDVCLIVVFRVNMEQKFRMGEDPSLKQFFVKYKPEEQACKF